MNEYEQQKAKDCVYNIRDKLNAIDLELHKEKPYLPYLLEKLEPIENDVRCLIAMCERGNKNV